MAGVLLHVGCGSTPLPDFLEEFDETRLDISPACRPDIVASMTSLGSIGPFEAVYSSHSLEHLYPHEVPVALREFRRVLTDGGKAVIIVPDLEDVRPTEEPLYETSAGPVCGLDLIYGMSRLIPNDRHMAHHSGFTKETLGDALAAASFSHVEISRVANFSLMAVAIK